jgi:hypothetical protein
MLPSLIAAQFTLCRDQEELGVFVHVRRPLKLRSKGEAR